MSKNRRNPPATQPKPTSTQHILATREQFSGPLPPPAALEHYEQILPGAADRIIAMAEQNSRHEHEVDKAIISIKESEFRRGQRYGFIIALTALVASVVCAIAGAENVAMVIGGTTVLGLASAFVYGRRKGS